MLGNICLYLSMSHAAYYTSKIQTPDKLCTDLTRTRQVCIPVTTEQVAQRGATAPIIFTSIAILGKGR
jgi:hypothetical protein